MLRSWPAETLRRHCPGHLKSRPRPRPRPRRAAPAAAPEVPLCWAVGAGSRTVFRPVVSLGLISVPSGGRFAECGCRVSRRPCAAEGTRCFSEAKRLLPLRTFVLQKRHLRGWELRANEVRLDRNTRFRPWGLEGAATGFLQAEVRGDCSAPSPPARPFCGSWFIPGSQFQSRVPRTVTFISHSTGDGYYIPLCSEYC